eukprot:CAMPEP_0168371798 /NCGR_PEP_ID=MMETSP0228-20121227/7955_1 /TAXON_ID=133427 /ORGANISM="Protoceratium reticulatum, Strain CCCM 535 (=CCMP 1889)" /LENGTH=57 /DNA_ID=CAMNT_0008384693 /DNA_START=257 /DNA_END=430 /DNA_ORIENTATION=+
MHMSLVGEDQWPPPCLQQRGAALGLGLAARVTGLALLGRGLREGRVGRKTQHQNAPQ